MITGHRGLPSKMLFTELDQLEISDEFYITVLGEKIAYMVDDIMTILPEETEKLRLVEEKDYCTLVTCTPYSINTHRLLLRGTRIPYNPESFEKAKKFNKLMFAIKLLLLALLLIVLYFIYKKLKDRKEKEKGEDNVRRIIIRNKLFPIIVVFSIIIFSFFNKDIYANSINSITVETNFENMQDKGISLDLYCIGKVKDKSIILRDELKDIEVDFGDMSASNMLNAAKILSESVKDKNILYSRKEINSKGVVVFDNLKDGAYLIMQTSKNEIDGKKYVINPFIIMLPYHFQGQIINDVLAKSKPEIIVPPNSGGSNPEDPDIDNPNPEEPSNPDSGDTNNPGDGDKEPQDGDNSVDVDENPKNPAESSGGGEKIKQPKTGDIGISKPIGIFLIASALFIYINRKR